MCVLFVHSRLPSDNFTQCCLHVYTISICVCLYLQTTNVYGNDVIVDSVHAHSQNTTPSPSHSSYTATYKVNRRRAFALCDIQAVCLYVYRSSVMTSISFGLKFKHGLILSLQQRWSPAECNVGKTKIIFCCIIYSIWTKSVARACKRIHLIYR